MLKLPVFGVEQLLSELKNFRDIPGINHNPLNFSVLVKHRLARDNNVPPVLRDLPLGDGAALLPHHKRNRIFHPDGIDEGAHVAPLQLLPGDGRHPFIGAVDKLNVPLPVGDKNSVKGALQNFLHLACQLPCRLQLHLGAQHLLGFHQNQRVHGGLPRVSRGNQAIVKLSVSLPHGKRLFGVRIHRRQIQRARQLPHVVFLPGLQLQHLQRGAIGIKNPVCLVKNQNAVGRIAYHGAQNRMGNFAELIQHQHIFNSFPPALSGKRSNCGFIKLYHKQRQFSRKSGHFYETSKQKWKKRQKLHHAKL
ncbi:hypothetical protein SDC9_86544 [bioreactor metagenome]|uniref:Uncharacterized protein n=1 Tax=bioreactor metagenome TaxID=1076179 RepID=A0A644ZHW3_9ZZZZ